MAGPEDEREERPEDLFEDLDKYFAPIKDSDWPEGEGGESASAPPAAEPDDAGPLDDAGTPDDAATPDDAGTPDDWGELEFDLPDEQELVASSAGTEGAGEDPSQTASFAFPPAEGAEAEIAPDPAGPSVAATPGVDASPSDRAPGDEWLFDSDEGASDDWERFRRSLIDAEEPEAPTEPATSEAAKQGAETAGAFGGASGFEAPSGYDELATPASDEPLDAATDVPHDVEAAAEHFAASVRGSPEDVERELLADLEDPGAPAPGTIRVDAAGADLQPPPPSWEEPTIAGPEDIERPSPTAGRNLPAAVISGLLLAVGAVALLAIGNGPFAFLAAIVVLVGQGELYAVLKARGAQPATALGLTTGLVMVVGGYLRGEAAVLFGLFLAMALSVLWYMAAPPPSRKRVAQNVGATLLGVVYVPFLASFALVTLRVPGVGRNLLLTVLGLTVLYDVCAYGIGSWWGSRPLAPTISPKKSWEGAVGATFLLLLVALAIVPSVEPFNAARAVGLALVLAVAAPIGDLVESALKRDLGVKDMGSILPGHGGILDRIDSILLAAPSAYYFLLLTA